MAKNLLTSTPKLTLAEIAGFTAGKSALVFAGLPFEFKGKLYNVAAALGNGEVLCFIPKTFIPSYGEFYEARHFYPGNREVVFADFNGKKVDITLIMSGDVENCTHVIEIVG